MSAEYLCDQKENIRQRSNCIFREGYNVSIKCLQTENDDLEEERLEKTRLSYGERSALVQKILFREGFLESGVLETGQVHCREDIRIMCEHNVCGAYGTTWACPPAVGSVRECQERISRFSKMTLFSKAYILEDEYDFDSIKETMKDFKVIVRNLNKQLKPVIDSFLLLSNESCDLCKVCTYPQNPCRFPEDMHPAIEGFGLNISELAEKAGIHYINGRSTVTFFGAVLY